MANRAPACIPSACQPSGAVPRLPRLGVGEMMRFRCCSALCDCDTVGMGQVIVSSDCRSLPPASRQPEGRGAAPRRARPGHSTARPPDSVLRTAACASMHCDVAEDAAHAATAAAGARRQRRLPVRELDGA